MKIVCDSCGAKYSIADEKVAGKVFKIRCKKCSAVIVVKGDQEEGDESTRVFDYGAEAIWHVVIDGDQQGPFAPRQIADLLAESKIDWEAYVWREGMDGWQPAKDVEVLVSAVMAEAESTAGAAKPAAAAAYGAGQVFGGSSDMGADPFAASADDGGLSGVMMGKSAGGGAGGADLFARSDRSPFSGAAEGDSNMMSGHANGHANSPRVSEDQSLTGQRNENSVLFSLSNLQALATGSGSAPASARPKPGMAQGEGSGLIDIRALASATQAVGEGRANGASKDSVEDLLAVGGGNAFSAASLAAPVAGDKSESNNTKLIAGFGGVIVVLLMGMVYLVMRQPAAAPVAEAPVAVAPVAPAAQAAAAPAAAAPANAEQPGDQAARAEDAEGEDEEKSARSGDRPRKRVGGSEPKAAEKAPEAPAATTPPKSSGDKSLDDLLDSALGGKPAAKPAAAPKAAPEPANLPSMPARDDVLGAMKGVTPRVVSCGNGQSGVAMAKINVAGSTGRVTNVDVSGQFAGTPVAACVTREVSKAKFPKFSQSSFSFSYPFKI